MLAGKNLSESIAERPHDDDEQAELLEWIGSGYGRPSDAEDRRADADGVARALAALDLETEPSAPRAAVARRTKRKAPFIFIAVAVSTFALVQWRFTSVLSSYLPHRSGQQSQTTDASTETVAVVATPVPEQPDTSTAREDKTAEPTQEADALKAAHEAAARDAAAAAQSQAKEAAAAVQRETEEKAAREAEQKAKNEQAKKEAQAATEAQAAKDQAARDEQNAKDALAVKQAQAAKDEEAANAASVNQAAIVTPAPTPVIAVPAAAKLEPKQAATTAAKTSSEVEISAAKPAAVQIVKTTTKSEAPTTKLSKSDIDNGRAFLAAGKLSAARQSFAKAAQSGMPEGALALGNTYDPVSLAKLGLKDKGNPELARHWYRRAHEIAFQQR